MPLREVEKGPWEGLWSESHIPRGGDFTGLKGLLHRCAGTVGPGGVRRRFSGDEPVGEGEGPWGRGAGGTHEKPGCAGSNPSRAGGALQLRFRGGASPA